MLTLMLILIKRKVEIKDLSAWTDILCLWAGNLNIAKMSILPNLIYRFNEIPIEITANYFVDMEKLIQKCTERQDPEEQTQ